MPQIPNGAVRQAAQEALMVQHDKAVMLTAYDQLRPSERMFVNVYVATDNPIKAIMAATPSLEGNARLAQVRAFDMLKRPLVQAAIAQKIDKLAEKYDVRADALVRELAYIGKSNIMDYLRLTPEGEPFIDMSEATPEMMAAIQSVTVEDVKDGRGPDAREIRKVNFKLHDKLSALDKLIKIQGLYAPVGVDMRVDGVIRNGDTLEVKETMTPEQAAELYQRSLEE